MNPRELEQLEQGIRARARALDMKRRSVGTEKRRLSMTADYMLKLMAIFFDVTGALVNIIPAVGGFIASAISFVGNVVFILIYILLRITPLNLKSKATQRAFILRIVTFIVELIPYVNIVPMFSVSVWYTSRMVRKEDREYNMRIRGSLEQIRAEERSLQYDMQRYRNVVQESEDAAYNIEVQEQQAQEQALLNQYEEAATITTIANSIKDDDDDHYRRAA